MDFDRNFNAAAGGFLVVVVELLLLLAVEGVPSSIMVSWATSPSSSSLIRTCFGELFPPLTPPTPPSRRISDFRFSALVEKEEELVVVLSVLSVLFNPTSLILFGVVLGEASGESEEAEVKFFFVPPPPPPPPLPPPKESKPKRFLKLFFLELVGVCEEEEVEAARSRSSCCS